MQQKSGGSQPFHGLDNGWRAGYDARREMSARQQNERKFDNWQELPGGGRRYWQEVIGRQGWKAHHIKEVAATEKIVAFWQEVYDSSGQLVEMHEKYPVDTGHRTVQTP